MFELQQILRSKDSDKPAQIQKGLLQVARTPLLLPPSYEKTTLAYLFQLFETNYVFGFVACQVRPKMCLNTVVGGGSNCHATRLLFVPPLSEQPSLLAAVRGARLASGHEPPTGACLNNTPKKGLHIGGWKYFLACPECLAAVCIVNLKPRQLPSIPRNTSSVCPLASHANATARLNHASWFPVFDGYRCAAQRDSVTSFH